MNIAPAVPRLLLSTALVASLVAGIPVTARALSVPTDPPVFSNPLDITNPLLPFVPGGLKFFSGKKAGEANVVADLFLTDTRTFMFGGSAVECHTLQETEFTSGVLSEISHNFFAQADDGSVYYFGEIADIYENGAIMSHEGSWLVGGPTLPDDPSGTGNAAAPGLYMPAAPALNDAFKAEDVVPVAEENDLVVKVGKTIKVKAGKFTGCIEVLETSDLDTDKEHKWYAPGVGVIRAKAKGESLELVATTIVPPGS